MSTHCELCGNFATRAIIKRMIACGYKTIDDYEIDIDTEEILEESATDSSYYCLTCYNNLFESGARLTEMVPGASDYPINQPINEE